MPSPDQSASTGELITFTAKGFSQPVNGIIYDKTTNGGMPLGGLGTGYIELNTDLTFGGTTIFNHFTNTRELNVPFVSVIIDERPAVFQSIRFWGHYPVADVEVQTDSSLQLSLRAFAPFVLGDAVASNIPAALFEIGLLNIKDSNQTARIALSFPGPEVMPGEPFERTLVEGDGVSGIAVSHGRDGRGYVIALVSDSERIACTPFDNALAAETISVDVDLRPNVQLVPLRFVIAWWYPHFRDSDNMPLTHHYHKRSRARRM